MTATQHKYHSALRAPEDSAPQRGFALGSSCAVVHDLTSGPLPAAYGLCDVLYADLPWGEHGAAQFNKRAGVSIPYRDLLTAVGAIIRAQPQPLVLVAGWRAAAHLPPPDKRLCVRLNGALSCALLYRVRLPPARDAADLLHDLATRYHRVGDFCCGYGRSGRIFWEHGREFTMSDYNQECIGYIAAHAAAWQRP